MRFPAVILLTSILTQMVVLTNAGADQLFVRRVAPLLREKCLSCHGGNPDEIEGGLDLRTFDQVQAGGDSEEIAIVLGKPDLSPLFLAAKRESDDWSCR